MLTLYGYILELRHANGCEFVPLYVGLNQLEFAAMPRRNGHPIVQYQLLGLLVEACTAVDVGLNGRFLEQGIYFLVAITKPVLVTVAVEENIQGSSAGPDSRRTNRR